MTTQGTLLGRRLNENTLTWGPHTDPIPDELTQWIQGPGPITMLDLVATLCLIDRYRRSKQQEHENRLG